MESRELFRENQLLDVFDRESGIFYKSIIQEINDEHLAIGVPMRRQGQLIMHEGTEWFFRLNVKDAQYYFTSKVIGRKHSGKVPLYLIAWPEAVKRYQRRRFFRLPCALEVCYWVLKEGKNILKEAIIRPGATGEEGRKKKGQDDDKTAFDLEKALGKAGKALAIDISGGGVLLAADRKLVPGTRLVLGIHLQSKREKKELFVQGRVVWSALFKEGAALRYRNAIEFENISERSRDEIISFIFLLMRERMKVT